MLDKTRLHSMVPFLTEIATLPLILGIVSCPYILIESSRNKAAPTKCFFIRMKILKIGNFLLEIGAFKSSY